MKEESEDDEGSVVEDSDRRASEDCETSSSEDSERSSSEESEDGYGLVASSSESSDSDNSDTTDSDINGSQTLATSSLCLFDVGDVPYSSRTLGPKVCEASGEQP